MIITYEHVIRLDEEEFSKIREKEEMIYTFKSDGGQYPVGEFIRFEERCKNGLIGEIRAYEIIEAMNEKETDIITARLRHFERDKIVL